MMQANRVLASQAVDQQIARGLHYQSGLKSLFGNLHEFCNT